MAAFKLEEMTESQLNIVPLKAIFEANGTHSCLKMVEFLIPFILHRRAIMISNDFRNLSIFYNPFLNGINLLQSTNRFLIRASLLTSFAYVSYRYASMFAFA